MRAFLAIPVLPPALLVVQALRERLVREVPAVRWGPAASLHITLHFFGAIGEEEAQRALDAVAPVVAAQAPLRLWLDGLGSFPSPRNPRVLWFGVDGDTTALAGLAQACTTALAAIGFAAEDRPYRPHCTIGRPRREWGAEARQRWSELGAQPHVTPAFTAPRVVLFESVSDRDGVRHIARASLPLGVGMVAHAGEESAATLAPGRAE